MKKLLCWIEAMRLRTLPVSIAGVIFAVGCAAVLGRDIRWTPAALCLAFAVLAQIASNFANEYYDYRDGLDRPGREGPRRGVTEGDISPAAMRAATFITLAIASAVGLSLVIWSGWWLIPVGIAIALGVIAYSAGPFPLSRHALGELAVICFFGLIPVNFTFWLVTGVQPGADIFLASLAAGLMGANVLLVNNYRDADDDRSVGKYTLVVAGGRALASTLYLFNGFIAVAVTVALWAVLPPWSWIFPTIYLVVHTILYFWLTSRRGHHLNPLLGATAMLMLFYALTFSVVALTANL